MSELQKTLLCLLESTLHSFDWILREFTVSHYHLVKLISEEVSALGSSVTIINCKEAAPGPEINLLKLRLDDVQDNGDAIFIVTANHALVRVCRIRDHNTVLLGSKLSRVVILAELDDLLLLHLHVFLPLAQRHLHPAVLHDIVRPQTSLLQATLFLLHRLQDPVMLLFLLFLLLLFGFLLGVFVLF